MKKTTIPTYIINLKDHIDKLMHVKSEFKDKPEFHVSVIEAIKHQTDAIELWQSIVQILDLAQQQNEDFIQICEDDHHFCCRRRVMVQKCMLTIADSH